MLADIEALYTPEGIKSAFLILEYIELRRDEFIREKSWQKTLSKNLVTYGSANPGFQSRFQNKT